MSVKEFAKEKFGPPTRGVGIDLSGYPLPSPSKPGKKSNKKNKEKEKETSRFGQVTCISYLELAVGHVIPQVRPPGMHSQTTLAPDFRLTLSL